MAESHKPGAQHHLEQTIISEREKPALDETTFQQLLEAAHVLQEQKGFEVPPRPRPNPAEALAEIVETQEFLRSHGSDLQVAANVIVERLQKITYASGVAVAVVREDRLEYCAATGDAANLAGTSVPMDSSLSADGQLSTEFSREHPDKHSIALPLYHEGNLAGLLEIRFADADSIQDPEMRSCQLMAGLMTEAIARAVDREWRQTLAAERAAMLEALERIKPQLERLAVEPATSTQSAHEVIEPAEDLMNLAEPAEARIQIPMSESSAKSGRETVCPQCGYQFGEQELFCGRCGTARPAGASSSEPSGDLQSKWASMWHLQQAAENKQHEEAEAAPEENELRLRLLADDRPSDETSSELSPELQNMMEQFSDEPGEAQAVAEDDSAPVIDGEVADQALVPAAVEPGKTQSPWASATKANKWLESLNPKSPGGIWLAKHRADLYVAGAVVLLLIVLSGWGMRPAESHVQSKNPPQPNLTLFEKLLINLGLAETPPTPVYLGNPNASVWVDLHTALYYCSDSEQYGKTSEGKYTTQRDAQMDQFEPAARKNCE
ncbi:MAG: GAF domain-containing protein [Terriglobales bacterium]